MFVFNAKSDRDGQYQPTLCIASRKNERLVHFDAEEIAELKRIAPTLRETLSLYERKAMVNRTVADEEERRRLSAQDSIGVEL